jgi:hypothetical protein
MAYNEGRDPEKKSKEENIMTKIVRKQVNSIEEATDFFGRIHKEYMTMVMTQSGTYRKNESWDLKDGQGTVEVTIEIED